MPQEQERPTSNEPARSNQDRYAALFRNTAFAAIVVCPLLALLPPRKLDIYTFGLVGTFAFSGDYLVRERTGRPISQHLGFAIFQSPADRNSRADGTAFSNPSSVTTEYMAGQKREARQRTSPVTEEIQTQREKWKREREKEIEEDIREGKGFGDMIMGQIWDVWNWGNKKDEDP